MIGFCLHGFQQNKRGFRLLLVCQLQPESRINKQIFEYEDAKYP